MTTSPARRSLFVTALAWAIIALSALVIPVSALALLMLLVGGDGTASTTIGGFLLVVVAPPAAFVTGIGLLRRRRWAWWCVLALLGIVIAINVQELLTWQPTTTTTVTPSGVTTTVLGSGPNRHSLPIIALCALLGTALLSRPVRSELGVSRAASTPVGARGSAGRPPSTEPASPSHPTGAWRVGHRGRDHVYYEERHQGEWKRIEIEGEMLMGRAHHVIYFTSPERWRGYPAWARDRRDEIVGRIKSVMRPPDYEYWGDGPDGPAPPAAPHAPAPPRPATPSSTATQRAALLLAIVILLGIAAGMGWMVTSGVEAGTTVFPSQRPSQRRSVHRRDEPATFWFLIGLYGAVGIGTGGLGLYGLRELRRVGRSARPGG